MMRKDWRRYAAIEQAYLVNLMRAKFAILYGYVSI